MTATYRGPLCDTCGHPAEKHHSHSGESWCTNNRGDWKMKPCPCPGYLAPAAGAPYVSTYPAGNKLMDEAAEAAHTAEPLFEVRTTATSEAVCPACNHRVNQHSDHGCFHNADTTWGCRCTARRSALETPESLRGGRVHSMKLDGNGMGHIVLGVDPGVPLSMPVIARLTARGFSPADFEVTRPHDQMTDWIRNITERLLREQVEVEERLLEPLWLQMVYGDRGHEFGILLERAPLGGTPRARLLREGEHPWVRAGELSIVEAPWPAIDWSRRIAEWEEQATTRSSSFLKRYMADFEGEM